ncbi:MAG: class I SAM-dependent methyltransferase, partial [Bacteroidota bacterium]
IGSGNGISALAFALHGIHVDAIEPDLSETIGTGAIKKLKEHYQLYNLNVHQAFAEELNFPDNNFDIVYTRQCMHHAHDLQQFLKECSRVLKKGGILITVRDHVVHNETDKKWFLENHPLQRFYGGENAFSFNEYKSAMTMAGLKIEQVLKHFDNVINYFPLSRYEKEQSEEKTRKLAQSIIKKKLGPLNNIGILRNIAARYVERKLGKVYDENQVPGRMYTFLASKN